MKNYYYPSLRCLAFTVQTAARNGFAIVIDSVSYQEARPEVDAYARAIERLHGLKVYTVIDRCRCRLHPCHPANICTNRNPILS